MTDKAEQIAALCREIDECAYQVYATLSSVSHDLALKDFWNRMSCEECRHVNFWKSLEASHVSRGMIHLLSDADHTLRELTIARDHALQLTDQSKDIPDLKGAFVLAYQMEFYLLHPAYELFFHLVPHSSEVTSPESEYDAHIAGFTEMLQKHEDLSPELRLLGDTLQQLWEQNRKLAVQSSHDQLTGLHNRRGFEVIAPQIAHLAVRNKQLISIIMLDLDNFKRLNDNKGHDAGDLALKRAASVIKHSVRASDLTARYGGEEFVILLANVETSTAGDISEKIRCAIEERCKDYGITASIGFVTGKVTGKVEDFCSSMMKKADTAMYSVKKSIKNSVAEYDPKTMAC